jgi:hypothetical protein
MRCIHLARIMTIIRRTDLNLNQVWPTRILTHINGNLGCYGAGGHSLSLRTVSGLRRTKGFNALRRAILA